MKTPTSRRFAWTGYGFRPGVNASSSNVADLAELPLAPQFRTTRPHSDVTLLLLSCLTKAETVPSEQANRD
jgi:hypothetical protein